MHLLLLVLDLHSLNQGAELGRDGIRDWIPRSITMYCRGTYARGIVRESIARIRGGMTTVITWGQRRIGMSTGCASGKVGRER